MWHTGKLSKFCCSKVAEETERSKTAYAPLWLIALPVHSLSETTGYIASRFLFVAQKEYVCSTDSTACAYWHVWSHTVLILASWIFLSIWSRARMGNDYDLSDMIRDVWSSANFWERCLWPCLSMCFNVFQCVSMCFCFCESCFQFKYYNVSWASRAPTHALRSNVAVLTFLTSV